MRAAVVTGGSRGIGAAICRRLAADGMAVVIGWRSDEAAARGVLAGIEQAGGRAVTAQADVADEAQAEALVEQAVLRFGRLDLLVNNAALAEGMALAELAAAHVDEHFAANVRGLLLASKHAAARMKAGAAIVNVSSINARSPVAGGAVYSATKAAVDAVTKALAKELGPRGIRVNAVAPGLIMTDRQTARVPQDALAGVIGQTPLGRLGQPEDVARVVSLLASEDAAWITGEILGASGGCGL